MLWNFIAKILIDALVGIIVELALKVLLALCARWISAFETAPHGSQVAFA
jgi:hypothetical protein